MDAINAASTLGDIASPGANLEKLKGSLAGFYSARINEKYRVVFQFANGKASRVQAIDYH
jgi:proteic killer suppression protein